MPHVIETRDVPAGCRATSPAGSRDNGLHVRFGQSGGSQLDITPKARSQDPSGDGARG